MALILSLETSSSSCSVALAEEGVTIGVLAHEIPQSHASKLAVLIEEVMRQAGTRMEHLQAIAVSAGPGSYTGLRIGTSTAKGLCFALNIPLIAIDTLTLLAHQVVSANPENAWLCPMIDARRMEVYCRVFDPALKPHGPVEAKVIDTKSFEELLSAKAVLFFGDGAAKCRDVITHPRAFFREHIYPTAEGMVTLAEKKFREGDVENLAAYEPFYLKEFIARKAQSFF